jgi:phage terminase small subunit
VADSTDFLAIVRERYQRCLDAERENRDRALDALRFRNLEQWDPKQKADRENDPEGARPCLVLDKLNQHVNQVVNDQRLNRPQIKVRPVDNGADPETAKVLDGLVRHIQDQSRADIAYDTAFEHSVDGGFGYWRIATEYCDDYSFDQDLRIKRVRNRFAVYLDPARQEPDGSDAQFGYFVDRFQIEDFKRDWPKADAQGFTSDVYQNWGNDKEVLVAEYFWIEPKPVTIVMLADPEGTVLPKDEYEADNAPAQVWDGQVRKAIARERETTVNQVLWRRVTGKEILEPTKADPAKGIVVAKDGLPAKLWPSKWIPLVETIGNELDIEGKRYLSGMIRSAMDAQRVYNYAASAFVTNVALAPTAPYVAAEGQLEGHENEWKSANRRNLSVLQYKPVIDEASGALLPAPQRQQMPGIPSGWQGVLVNADMDIQASMGRYAASVGEPSNEKSGKAITARNRESDVGTFHFQDNVARSMLHTGRILIDLIPKIYDTKRIARILGEDGSPQTVQLDPELKDDAGKPMAYAEKKRDGGSIERIYNLGVGKYDVTVQVGPSFTTRRQEAAEFLTSAVQGAKDPVTANVLAYLAMKSQDWAGSDEAVTMLKKLIPPNIVEDDDEADVIQTAQGPIPKDQAGAVIEQLQQQVQALTQDAELTKEKNRTLDLQIQGKQLLQKDRELDLKAREIDIRERDSKYASGQREAQAAEAGANAVLDTPLQ